MDDKKAEAGMAPPTYNDAMYPKQPGSNPAMTQPFPPYPTQAGVAPYPTQPGQPAYPAGVSSCHQITPHPRNLDIKQYYYKPYLIFVKVFF